MNSIHRTHCPACASSHIGQVLSAEDYTVSHESFQIWECSECLLRFTQMVPAPELIGKYYQSDDYISHTDTNKGIVNKLYHAVRRITLRRKCRLVQQQTGMPTGKLLDIGAGTGAFVHAMQGAGWQVTGLEPDAGTRLRAAELHKVNLLDTSALFDLPEAQFNAITLWHVLEHVHDLHPYLDQMAKLLTANGVLLIAVPNYTSLDGHIYQQYWAAYDVPRHLYHFSPASIAGLMGMHGLRVREMRPMWFDSFYISMLSEQYKSGKSRLLSAVWNGLRSNLAAAGKPGKCSSVIYIIQKQ